MSFVHLHLHSDYSLLDGIGTCDEYAELCVKYGHEYLAVSDHGMMAAVPAQTQACLDHGIKPIYAIEAYLNDHHDLVPNFKDLSDAEKKACRDNFHLTLFAKDNIGYRNLVRISSDAWVNGFYYKPRTNKNYLEHHTEGVIASSACLAGEIPEALRREDYKTASELVRRYRDLFEDFYLELMLLDIPEQTIVNSGLVQLSEELDCPLLLTNDVHYATQEDADIQKVALLINSREGTINNPKGLKFDSIQLWFKSEGELDEAWDRWHRESIPEDLYQESKSNTIKIARQCEGVEMDLSPKLPTIDDADEKLFKLVAEAMKERGFDKKPEYVERAKKEMGIILEKGFSSYFLIMKEIIDHAKYEMRSIVGPGRGSGPGFLINYLLGLCEVDPIKYDLLSERFLSPHRGGKFAKLKFSKELLG